MFIPFHNDETEVYFDSRVTKKREIMERTHIIMTGGTEWYPQLFQLALVQTNEKE